MEFGGIGVTFGDLGVTIGSHSHIGKVDGKLERGRRGSGVGRNGGGEMMRKENGSSVFRIYVGEVGHPPFRVDVPSLVRASGLAPNFPGWNWMDKLKAFRYSDTGPKLLYPSSYRWNICGLYVN